MSCLRAWLVAVVVCGVSMASSIPLLLPQPAAAQSTDAIVVEGNRRVEAETVRSYFKAGAGGHFDQVAIDDGLKALIETGLFQDVKVDRAGGRIIVSVVESAVIGRIAFEGNKKIKQVIDPLEVDEVVRKAWGAIYEGNVTDQAQLLADFKKSYGAYLFEAQPAQIPLITRRDVISACHHGPYTAGGLDGWGTKE